jgi:hypothetical protein
MEKSKSSRIVEFLLGIIAVFSCVGTYMAVPGLAPIFFITPSPKPPIKLVVGATKTPSPTRELPDTPSESILHPGQSWFANGRELLLLHINQNQSSEGLCRFSLEFTFKNHTIIEQVIPVSPDDFSLLNESGVEWMGVGVNCNHECNREATLPAFIGRALPNGVWEYAGVNSWIVWFDNPPVDSVKTIYRVRVNNILPVAAYWEIQIAP